MNFWVISSTACSGSQVTKARGLRISLLPVFSTLYADLVGFWQVVVGGSLAHIGGGQGLDLEGNRVSSAMLASKTSRPPATSKISSGRPSW